MIGALISFIYTLFVIGTFILLIRGGLNVSTTSGFLGIYAIVLLSLYTALIVERPLGPFGD